MEFEPFFPVFSFGLGHLYPNEVVSLSALAECAALLHCNLNPSPMVPAYSSDSSAFMHHRSYKCAWTV